MILHVSRRVLLPPEDWSSSNASFSYRPWTTVASATHGPWRHRLRAKTVPFRCLESVSDAGSIIGPKWEINMLNTFNALFDFFGSDAARRFSRWCQCMVAQCRRPAPSQQKKKSVCPVVGDLPPIYGKFSGENDDKHGFVWVYTTLVIFDVFFVCVSTATSGNGCSDALLLWGLTPVQGTLFDTPRPFRYESQNRFRQRQISATSFEHCHGSIAQLSFQQGPDGALCNSLCWNTPEGSRRHATCC